MMPTMTSPRLSIIDMLAQLVAQPTVSSHDPRLDCSNAPALHLLAGWLEELGFTVRLMAVQGRAGREKFNLIAQRGGGTEGLVLSGHIDTVPCDEHGWHSDPFKLTELNGRLYGLGCADMKSFFPLVIEALQGLGLKSLQQPLMILATADEESSMAGAKALAVAGEKLGRHALIGEPTALKPVRMHKGVMMEALRIHGQSGHASNPALGKSALEGMQRVMTRLLDWRQAGRPVTGIRCLK